MTRILDIRYRTPRTNGTRKLSQVKNIARHHSATTTGNFDTFWKHWHNTRGWGTGGYHEIILRDGTVELCYGPEEITNGVLGLNSTVYNICLVGNGSFADEQERVFDERVKTALRIFNLPVSAVKGHREFPGSSTTCPGINMDVIRKRLASEVEQVSNPKIEQSAPVEVKAEPSTNGIKVDGYWGPQMTRALQAYFRTPIDGIISGQPINRSTENIPSVRYGSGGSRLIMAMQRFYGTPVDGQISGTSQLIMAMQRKYGLKTVDGFVSKPSALVMELQRRLNAGKL